LATAHPLGVSLYISCAAVNRDLLYVSRAAFPVLVIQDLLRFTSWPDLILLLPRLIYGYGG